jgi:hypothetical protein
MAAPLTNPGAAVVTATGCNSVAHMTNGLTTAAAVAAMLTAA